MLLLKYLNIGDKMAYSIKQKRKQAIEEFEYMINMAELKTIMKISLERPLTKEEFKKVQELKTKLKL
jgi:hypothetical protein